MSSRLPFVAMCLVCAWGSARAAEPCEDQLLPTPNVVSYLEALLAENILGPAEIEFLKHDLAEGVVTNPLSREASDTATLIHQRNLDRLLPLAEPAQLKAWAETTLERLTQTASRRGEVEEQTRDDNLLMHFVKVRGGTVEVPGRLYARDMPAHAKPVKAKIPDFKLTSTLITQAQWIQIMKSNPAAHKNLHTPDLEMPIRGVTWWSAAEFANRLSISQNLPPFYDFGGITWEPRTSAEAGTLLPSSNYAGLTAWEKSMTDVHHKMGYRFPLGREWFWAVAKGVAHQLGRAPEEITWEDIKKIDLHEVAWLSGNSPQTPHSTAEEGKFLYVDENPLFDILGNLWQFTTDLGESHTGLNGKRFLSHNYTVGGSVRGPSLLMFSFDLGNDHAYTGFRLARSLPPK